MKKLIAVAAIAASLSACGESARSVQYFVSHPEEIAVVLKNCQENTGAANCDAAGAAEQLLAQKKWMGTPPKRNVW